MEYRIINNKIDKPLSKAWVEIEFSNFGTSEKTTIFAGCTRNYLKDHFNDSIEDFLNFIINKWAPNTDIIFNEKIRIEPYSDTEEGIKNISDFLNEISKR